MSFFSKLGKYQEFIPKSIICLREGYTRQTIYADLLAGMTVGIIALPLAMAFAIGSGVNPDRGLFTAIVAGFLVSLLGGSRVQIGGPTGAFVVIIYSIVQRHGYDGLAIATLLGGAMMILMGLARFGVILKFIPYPVTTGFTTGIALIIFSSQVKDFFGLAIDKVPADFTSKWALFFQNAGTWNPWAFGIALFSLGLIIVFRRFAPRFPGALVALILAASFTAFFEVPVETVAKKFGEIPRSLPTPHWPSITFDKIRVMFPDAITIALLGAIESLLCAVVADGMTGNKHRSNCELVAQGLANIGSILFGGIPATGAIARTTANIKMHAKTPLAGMTHAVCILLLMVLFAPWAGLIPLSALAAVLVVVAWNMSELNHFFSILKGQKSDIAVLLITFFATILIDLTVAVQLGVILAALLFLKRMTDTTTGTICALILEQDRHDHEIPKDSNIIFKKNVPDDVIIFEINGPFFFGVSDILNETLRQLNGGTKVFILRMNKVPLIDSTGIQALKQFHAKCQQKGIIFLMSAVNKNLRPLLQKTNVESLLGADHFFPHLEEALKYARTRHENRS